ncbi:hypothetical protein EDE08_102579 [Bradyrhizobium sp. R2.2-H]|jgi:hypothetical protein|uniref:hypothetical protein n=1 Tax=unclassified Bradyrhizobium TaxID=2631580 RepID=UPI00104DED18|nr:MULTISPECIES: hypothetical protein [unclassified Bradyrhizobium]TCU77035.1 hypothetical protein EDE10_102579 [Bradyrhizobium sp. Y-H1]TCU80108.1 hypothetical protein EDE08_102579 [Bradyrhizobium sp. R2.2-H]
MDREPQPTFASLEEEEAALRARLEKIAQFKALAHELKIPLAAVGITTGSPVIGNPSLTINSSPKHCFDGTIAGLVKCYRADERSPYFKLKHKVRNGYDGNLNKIVSDFGHYEVEGLTADRIMGFYHQWAEGGKIAMGHALAAKLRLLSGFGATTLGDARCIPFAHIMRTLRFPAAQARLVPMTADYATAVRRKAHEIGWPSIALAQAIQFELKLRQVDVIGEWIPLSDPTPSTIVWGNEKWVRGLRWSDVDDKLILRFTTVDKVKRKIPHEVDLTKLPMVLEELEKLPAMPTSGPMIICEANDRPYSGNEFRRKWRLVANKAGLPDNIRNADNIRAEARPSQEALVLPWQNKTAG